MRLFYFFGICCAVFALCHGEVGTTTRDEAVDIPTEDQISSFDFDADDEVEKKRIDSIVAAAPIPASATSIGQVKVVDAPLKILELDAAVEKELDDHKEDLIKFHKKFKKNIPKSALKEAAKNFKANNKKLREKRKQKKNFKLGMHPFMHLSEAEIKKIFIDKTQIAQKKRPKLVKVGKKNGKKNGKKKAKKTSRAKRDGAMDIGGRAVSETTTAGQVTRNGAIDPFGDVEATTQNQAVNSVEAETTTRNGAVDIGGLALDESELPKAFDWREKNVLNEVRGQGACASCWTFSATVAVEATYAIKYKEKIDLSEQQLTCVYNKSTICKGGWPDDSLIYLKDHGGQTTEEEFPYDDEAAHNTSCKKVIPKVELTDVGDLLPFDMEKTKQALIKNGPIAFGMYVNDDFMDYEAGIFDTPCGKEIIGGHAMAIIGYGEEAGVPYWIVRNQWGNKWGEDGHVRVKAGVNLCRIEDWFMVQAAVK